MKEYLGMLSIFSASFSASLGGLIGKFASLHIHVFDLVMIRFIIQLILTSLLCYFFTVNPMKQPFILQQIFRGFLGAVTFSCAIWANANMELSSATMIRFIGPLFTMVLAKFYLQESISRLKVIGMVLGFTGMVIVSKPSFIFGTKPHPDYPMRHYAIIANLVSAIALSFSTVLTKKIINQVNILSMMWYFAVVSAIATSPLQLIKMTSSDFSSMELPLIMSICYFTSQLLSNLGMKFVPASVATLIQMSDVIFGLFFGVVVFREELDGYSVFGCLLVMSVNLLMAYEKYSTRVNYVQLETKPDTDEIELEQVVKYSNK
eukprot:NODE_139_length_16235_cov_0.569038.p7 type:complete len:319 gc:universal NODE_139_length_16235_cov_0.569038:5415-6371(+)